MPDHFGTGKSSDSKVYRRITFADKPKICERCGYDKHKAAIIIHHKDRDRNNAAIENLEVLCCNCHAIEHYNVKPIHKNNVCYPAITVIVDSIRQNGFAKTAKDIGVRDGSLRKYLLKNHINPKTIKD